MNSLDTRKFPYLSKFFAKEGDGQIVTQHGDENDGETAIFEVNGREEYVDIMKKAGYVEQPEFEGKESKFGYWCANCEYFTEKGDSPTGYWCKKYNFPDRPHGCSAGWEWEKGKLI